MAKCAKCQKRKAKRFCIALGKSLCSLCCGLLREKEIYCPPICSFLVQHKPYQEDRMIEKRQKEVTARELAEEDILKDERMAWLAFQAEIPINTWAAQKGTTRDRDVLLALKYAKDKLAKGTGPLILPEKRGGPLNELGEEIFRRIEGCRYERRVILPDSQAGYSREEKIKCLDRLMLAVHDWSQGNFDGRAYLDKLADRFSRLQKISDPHKIITRS